ncbi:hypothetical protein HOLleu_07663 [Holothuria leucospilota]|uniref:Uncharacterized protein n=1 Tax=Holothuria leucospilota TaxID=206669 RepID=A0A9Q1HH54_HOLLE|nr:hypothetical protein HOLleu_07663 [Holothuria leucospilota]
MADEDIAALKKSCNGYLGVMSRYYKEQEVLFTDHKNYGEVLKKNSELQGIFGSYESKYTIYMSKLPEKEAKDAAEKWILIRRTN